MQRVSQTVKKLVNTGLQKCNSFIEGLYDASDDYLQVSDDEKSNLSIFEVETLLKNKNHQLSKKLLTLDYITSLELTSSGENNLELISDMRNLKNELKLEVVAILDSIKYYNTLV